jgi:hypothetical protein
MQVTVFRFSVFVVQADHLGQRGRPQWREHVDYGSLFKLILET